MKKGKLQPCATAVKITNPSTTDGTTVSSKTPNTVLPKKTSGIPNSSLAKSTTTTASKAGKDGNNNSNHGLKIKPKRQRADSMPGDFFKENPGKINSPPRKFQKVSGASMSSPMATESSMLPYSTFMFEKKYLATVPGSAFGKNGEGFLRISYASNMENLKKSIECLESFMAE